jgi:hypothetical protein
MGRDTYPGGGSIVRPTENGTDFKGSSDPAEEKNKRSRSRHEDDRRPTKKEIEKQAEEDEKQEGKLVRSFISQCATAHASAELNASFPEPPKSLRPWIINWGGNISWIVTEPSHRSLFHKRYCEAAGKEITIEELSDQLRKMLPTKLK